MTQGELATWLRTCPGVERIGAYVGGQVRIFFSNGETVCIKIQGK